MNAARTFLPAGSLVALLIGAACSSGAPVPPSPRPVQGGTASSSPESTPTSIASAAPAPAPVSPCTQASQLIARVPGLRTEGKLDRTRRVLARAAALCPEKASETWEAQLAVLGELGAIEERKQLAVTVLAAAGAPEGAKKGAQEARAQEVRTRSPEAIEKARKAFEYAARAWLKKDYDTASLRARDAWTEAAPLPEALVLAGRAALAKGDRAEARRLFDRALVDAIRHEGKGPNGEPPPTVALVPPDNAFRELVSLPGAHPLLATLTETGDVMVLDLGKGFETRIGIGASVPRPPALVGDGSKLHVIGGNSFGRDTLLVYDRATSQLVRVVPTATLSPQIASISPDGTRASFVGRDRDRLVLSIQDLQNDRSLGVTKLDNPGWISFTPDGRSVAVGNEIKGQFGDDFSIRFYDAKNARPLHKLSPQRKEEMCGPPSALSPDGRFVATMVAEPEQFHRAQLRLFDAKTGKQLTACDTPDITSARPVKLAFSPDGSVLVGLFHEWKGGGTHLRPWDTPSCRIRPALAQVGKIEDFSFVDGAHVATVGRNGIRILDVGNGQINGSMDRPVSAANNVTFSRDGQIAWGLHAGTVFVWNPSAGGAPRRITAHKKPVTGVAFSLNGKALATSGGDAVILWDTLTGEQIRTLSGHGADVEDVISSPDGKLLLSVSDDKTARIWDAATGRLLQTLLGHQGPVYSAAFSPDGSIVATGGRDGRILVHDTPTGRLVREIVKGSGYVYGLAFMGKESLWAWTTDRVLRRWDITTGTMIAEQTKGHGDGYANIALMPDGREIAVTGLAGFDVAFFDTSTAEPVRTLKQSAFARDNAFDVAISADGRLLAGASADGSLYLWHTKGEKPILAVRAAEGHDAAIAFTEDGYVDFMGPEADRLRRLTICTVGRHWFPFEVCEERLHVPGLFAKVLKDDLSFREP
jgi:WD40 repeat protein